MLAAFNELVEQRIREAMRRGDFDRLPGEGRPLDLALAYHRSIAEKLGDGR
jgi:hypothetical protein